MRRHLAAAAITIGAIVSAATASAGDLRVERAWARATPGALTSGAAYFTITNESTAPDRLVAAESPVAGHAAVHMHAMEGGVAKMRPLAALPVEPGETVTLKPGGLHIMLMQLSHPLREGETFPLTLTFERAGAISVDVPVQPLTASGPPERQ